MKLLYDAATLAEKIVSVLAPFCDRIETAGSIRRARSHVNDIDVVALPKPGQESALRARITQRATPVTDGPHTLIVRLPIGFQLDVWFAHAGTRDLLSAEPTNWGSVLLCRTGSKEHNIYLAARARELGLKWETMRGITADGKVIASATEEEIFRCLGLEFIPPALRER